MDMKLKMLVAFGILVYNSVVFFSCHVEYSCGIDKSNCLSYDEYTGSN